VIRLEVAIAPVPVEAVRAFLEPLGYRLDWAPETDGIGFAWQKPPLSETGVRAAYYPQAGDDPDEAVLVLETDGRASAVDDAVRDVTARLMAERFDGARVWCATSGRAAYGGGQAAVPPAPRWEPPRWYS
jgi:hypothetical protein